MYINIYDYSKEVNYKIHILASNCNLRKNLDTMGTYILSYL